LAYSGIACIEANDVEIEHPFKIFKKILHYTKLQLKEHRKLHNVNSTHAKTTLRHTIS
jgi:hypothetical protein